jgi:tRNA A-37 threonylcarbamoyl transferase component Bud32
VEPVVLASGRYRLVARLGAGGMAEVWKAYDEAFGVWRAIKRLHPAIAAQPGLRQRFAVEARTMARLRHPNLVAVHDVGEDDGAPWLVMDLLPGGSLADAVKRVGRLPAGQAARLVAGMLDGLAVAHATGVIHRDVKPHNVLIDAEGRPVLSDFGIARLVDDARSTTRTGMALGTLAYMAPEQRTNARAVDGRADLYAAGATFVACWAGQEPYDLHVEAAFAEQTRGLDPKVAAALARAVRWAPEDRYPDATSMAAALRDATADDTDAIDLGEPETGDAAPFPDGATWAGGAHSTAPLLTPTTPTTPAPPTPVEPSRPRSWVPLAAVGGGVGLAALLAILWAVGAGDRAPPAEVPVDLHGLPSDVVVAHDGQTVIAARRMRVVERPIGGGPDVEWPTPPGTDVDSLRLDSADGAVLARLDGGHIARLTRAGHVEDLGFVAEAAARSPTADSLLVIRPEGLSIRDGGSERVLRRISPNERRADAVWSADGRAVGLLVHVPAGRMLETRLEVMDAASGVELASLVIADCLLPTAILTSASGFVVAGQRRENQGPAMWRIPFDAAQLGPATLEEARGEASDRIYLSASRDGAMLVVTAVDDPDVWVLDGDVARPLVEAPGDQQAGAWLGDVVAYTSYDGDHSAIHLSGAPDPAGSADSLRVVRSGDHLAWWHLVGDRCELVRWRPDEPEPALVASTPRIESGITCPFAECASDGFPCVYNEAGGLVVVDPPAPPEPTGIAVPTPVPSALSPDGTRFVSTGAGRLVIESLAGGTGAVVVTPPDVKIYAVAWRPDGDGWWLGGLCDGVRPCLATVDGDGTTAVRWRGDTSDRLRTRIFPDPDSERVAFTLVHVTATGVLRDGAAGG